MRLLVVASLVLAACTASTGPQGPEGPQGPAGATGPQGPRGEAGSAGPKGDPGSTGPQGVAGAQGAAGAQGVAGPQGVQGPAGAVQVIDGGVVVGPPGSSVVVTPIASGGATCPTGGVRVTQLSDAGITNVCNGAAGPVGPTGPQGLAGVGVTVTVLANMSAQCLTGGVLITSADGGVVAVCNGAQGPQGLAGATGAIGPAGATGSVGPAGPTGAVGPTGSTGAPGPAGAMGATGAVGPAGATGAVGPAGAAGPAGPAGSIGPSGPPGQVQYVDGGVVALSTNWVSFAGFTATTYTGDLGGFPGANAKCRAEFPGSTFCTTSDFSRADPIAAPSTSAWIDFDRDSVTGERSTNPCNIAAGSWTHGGTSDTGGYLNPTAYTTSSNCNVARPLSCCFKPTVRVFRGFTTATFTGDLGGFTGANAKCNAEFPGSSFCTSADYSLSNTASVPGAAGAWVDFNRDSEGGRSTNPCNIALGSWTHNGTSDTGGYLNATGYTTSSNCNVSRPLACCAQF